MASKCPACGVITSVDKGKPTPPHQEKGTRKSCSGAGRPGK